MPYKIYTRISKDASIWSPVIDTDASWKKASVVDKIFMSEAECREFIDRVVRGGEEAYQYVDSELHKIVEIDGTEPSYKEQVEQVLKENNVI